VGHLGEDQRHDAEAIGAAVLGLFEMALEEIRDVWPGERGVEGLNVTVISNLLSRMALTVVAAVTACGRTLLFRPPSFWRILGGRMSRPEDQYRSCRVEWQGVSLRRLKCKSAF
jgi:hypothetical protein